MLTLNTGTIEILIVDLYDKLGGVDDLATIPVYYRVLTEDETVQVDWTPVLGKSGMRVYPVIDTTIGDWPEGTYKLYIRPTVPPESPVLGPMEFGLS